MPHLVAVCVLFVVTRLPACGTATEGVGAGTVESTFAANSAVAVDSLKATAALEELASPTQRAALAKHISSCVRHMGAGGAF